MAKYKITKNSKILITGISGFAGSFLAEALVKKKCRISGTVISDNNENIDSIKDKLRLFKCDLKNYNDINVVVNKTDPDFIFHLAALPSPADSFKNVGETLMNNILAEVNLLESVRVNLLPKKNPGILVIASADEYGVVSGRNKIDENTPLNPASPYAVSKIAQDFLGLQYFNAYKMNIVRVRPFNHIGPRQSPAFVIPSFAKQIAEIESDPKKPLLVGNLEAIRDFTDVRDMVKAYILALENCPAGEVYNLGSGTGYKISDLLDILLSLSKIKITVKKDPARFRPIDIQVLVCNNLKFNKLTDWKPEIKIKDTLSDVLNYWKEKVV